MPQFVTFHLCHHTKVVDHVAEPRLLDWSFANFFPAGQEVIPFFKFGCCDRSECKINSEEHLKRERTGYLPAHYRTLATLTAGLYSECQIAKNSVSSFNSTSSSKNRQPGVVFFEDFEDVLQRANGWIFCAHALMQMNGPQFFFDICVAFAESVMTNMIAMRITLDRITEQLDTFEPALPCHPEDVRLLTSYTKLRQIAPHLMYLVMDATAPMSLQYDSPSGSFIRETIDDLDMSAAHGPFGVVWRQKIERINLRRTVEEH